MEYLLLIYADELTDPGRSDNEAQNAKIIEAYQAFAQEAQEAGIVKGLNPLQPTDTATTVRIRNGKVETSDGPFAETKEQLAGYFLVDCENLDQALAWAAKIPGAKWGSIEVRPIWKFSID